MPCPSATELHVLAGGTAPPEARSALDAHLATCPACLATLAAVGHTVEGPSDADSQPPAARVDVEPTVRYRLDREIARGGMGRIFAAHDRLLDRPVAIKLLRTHAPGLAHRFLRERQITARLQHPAIVPIYDAGVLDDGEPFFAMRMVSGKTLERAAAEAGTLEERLRLLPAVIGVADAIAYAHGEGIIHRDLKPQNVLVGPFGEVVVLDWGIARASKEDDGADASTGLADERGRAEPQVTQAGDVLGTLAYMAPEQAAGSAVDERADVFGLGAILFQVITGALPNLDRTSVDSAARSDGRVTADLSRYPELPPELVAIVQRAMAPSAADRYPTARELAEDLKRWQAGRMVRAYDYTPGQLARRWIRRHRTKLAVAASATVVALVLGGLAVWQVVVERRAATVERDRAERARGAAEEQRAAAEALLGFVLGDLRARLENVGRLDALDGVARAVLEYQRRTPTADTADAWLQRSTAASLAGDVARATGDFAAAEAAFTRALAAAQAAAAYGATPRAEVARCRAYVGLGNAREGLGEIAAADLAFDACAEAAAASPAPELGELRIASRVGQARLARSAGNLGVARQILDDILPFAEDRARADGPASAAASELFMLRVERWETLVAIGGAPAQVDEARAMLALAEARIAQRPDDVGASRFLYAARIAMGAAAETEGRHADADAAYVAALEMARAVAAREPSNAEWQRDVGTAMDHLGTLKLKTGDHAEAIALLRECDTLAQRISALEPANPEWQRDRGAAASKLGDILMVLGRHDEARTSMNKAIAIYEQLARTTEDAGRAAHELGLAYGHLGGVEISAGDRPAAAAALRRSIELFRTVLATGVTPAARQELAATLLLLARIEGRAAARAAVTEALAILAPLRAFAADNPDLTELLASADELAARFGR